MPGTALTLCLTSHYMKKTPTPLSTACLFTDSLRYLYCEPCQQSFIREIQ